MVLSLNGLNNVRLSKVKVFVQSLPLQTGNGCTEISLGLQIHKI